MDLMLSRPHQARLDLISGIKALTGYRITPQVRARHERRALEQGLTDAQLRDRGFMDRTVGRDPLYQASRGLQRVTQELMWREVARALESRRDMLHQELTRAPAPGDGATLQLDAALQLPEYYSRVEYHLQPGGLWQDPLTGPIYEIGVQHFNLHRFGRSGAEMGLAVTQALRGRDLRRVLELGCGPGYKAYPILEAWPQVEAHGIDLSAPLLRYAWRRAIDHGRRVHYRQMNAERLAFPDASFDAVFDMILLHEVPVPATRNILREAWRVLEPGGVYVDLDLPAYRDVDPLTAFTMDWDNDHNGEPYWRAYHELDMREEMTRAGFVDVELLSITSDALARQGNYQGKWSYRAVRGRKP